jgi:Tfp pilus assembly protein PilF
MEDQSEFHLQLAYGHWEVGDAPQAIEELQISLMLEPDNAASHFMLGFIYSGRQMNNEAIQSYRQAILLEPDWHEVINNLGVVFLQLERWEEAMPLFEELTRVPHYGTPGHAYNNLGWAQYNMGLHRESLSNFEMATYLQPDLCLAYNNQGLALMALERSRDATEVFEDVIERCDSYAEPHFYLGRLRQLEGRYEEATTLFERCETLEPRSNLGRRCNEFL